METHVQAWALAVAAIAIAGGTYLLDKGRPIYGTILLLLGVAILAADGFWIARQLLKEREMPRKLKLVLGALVVAVASATGGFMIGRWTNQAKCDSASIGPLASPSCDSDAATSEACGVLPRGDITPCESELPMTPEQIWEEGKSRTAYEQATGAWSKYVDACVKWTLRLKGMEPKGDILEVYFDAGRTGILTVAARVRAIDYSEVKLANVGTPIEVRGRILFVQVGYIALRDVVLRPQPAPPQ